MSSRLHDVILRGLLASRPAIATVAPGTLYFATDTGATSRAADDLSAWETYSAAGSTPTGLLIGVRVFTTVGAGTYTPTAGTNSIIMELVGGGGGGAGVAQAATSQINISGSGSGGAYLKKRLTSGFSGAAYVVGAKGAGGAAGNNAGANGVATTFTSTVPTTYTAGPGLGGLVGSSLTPPWIGPIPVVGGTATNGDINIGGGGASTGYGANIQTQFAGGGGMSQMSPGAPAVRGNGTGTGVAGLNATGYGGGGGAAISSSNGGGNQAGGNGSDGIIIIWEYS